MSTFFSRVREAAARYTRETGEWPTQLFLGPKEYEEFNEMCLADPWHLDGMRLGKECAGMTIIGLMSDGLRVGRTVE